MNKICKISLFSAILASVVNMPADARITVKKGGSYANAYKQVVDVRQQAEYMTSNEFVATTASATPTLPVAVDDEKLAQDILNNASAKVSTADLEMCSMIYPGGIFKWGVPETGIRRNPTPQCIAVVELRDANTKAVLAQTTLAAGDAMKCNIDMFPESGWLKELEDVTLPADAAPTMLQTEQVMDQEQKQNAGLKIAAAAIISGIAGNMLAPKEAGDTKLLGTSKTQLIDTAIGATAGAGVMAASTYTGKVKGDTIKSTAVNAAAGMVVGNMAAGMSGGNGILYVTKCSVDGQEQDCIIGRARIAKDSEKYSPNDSTNNLYLINQNKDVLLCERDKCQPDMTTKDCRDSCKPVGSSVLIKVKLKLNSGIKLMEDMKSEDWKSIDTTTGFRDLTEKFETISEGAESDTRVYYIVQEGVKGDGRDRLAYAVFDFLPRKLNGYKTTEWSSLEANKPRIFARNTDGSVGDELKEQQDEKIYFTPSSRDANDGALVDLSNEARTKATITGAVAGGALGGFSGYQGATQEVAERWTSASREYDNSLTNFVCMTGSRFLAKYNDYAEIPEMQKTE